MTANAGILSDDCPLAPAVEATRFGMQRWPGCGRRFFRWLIITGGGRPPEVGTQVSINPLLVIVAGAMFASSLYAGRRVARVLAEKIVRMDHRERLLANLATTLLVGIGANRGLPMSTTHVSTGAIAGIAGGNTERLNWSTMRHFALAWTVTPLVAGLIAGMSYLIAVRMTSQEENQS